MQTIKINSHRYIQYEELIKDYPSLAKGSRNSRRYVTNNDLILNQDYIFASLKKDEWIQSDGNSDRVDKVFLRKSYVDKLELDEEDEYKDAPPVIELSDSEKFHDDKGNTYNVETRGTRHVNDIYFRVKDVAEAFGINRLHDTIILNKRNGYIENIHYTYFYLTDNNNDKKSRKLFLMYDGFRRVIETSKKSFTIATRVLLNKWLIQIVNHTYQSQFIINIERDQIIQKRGYAYCITSPIIDYVKIGFWRGTIEALKQRYVTYYGNNVSIQYVLTEDARKLEGMCHEEFKKHRIGNELFNKDYLGDYYDFLVNNKEEVNNDEDNEETDNEDCEDKSSVHCYTQIKQPICFYLELIKEYDDKMKCIVGVSDNFNKMFDHNLICYSYIDPQFLSEAETDVKTCMDGLDVSFSYKKEKELVIVPKKKLKFIKDQYYMIGEKYSGHHSQLIKELNDLKAKLKTQELVNNAKIDKLEHQLELQTERHEKEMLKKELEIERLKNS